ncbi:mucin-5B-like [Gadus chalcogrammus]|uniref:mucin-5B-like n=1 Tax=Gadus chalcogrammus TaxID=1042646 RepID=UPI0024C4E474|nr:mucin-5B-like [Gadus chalcogrammus]
MRKSRMPLGWATVWLFFCFGPLTSRSVIIETSSLMQNITDVSPLHNGQFCSTWGNHHFKTFDGDFFQFPFACNYVLTSHCRSDYEDFNIQLSRQQVDGVASIKRVMMRLDGVLVELANTTLTVDDKQITIPFSQYGLSIQRKGSYVRIEAKLGLVVMWNENDTLWVEMDEKYMNQTCGLCGDYNGVQLYNEFISHGVVKGTLNYGTSWKVDAPTETCMESHQEPTACADQTNRCMELLSEPAFLSCQDLLNMDAFVEACEKDLCHCGNGSTCLCPTMAEFSRQCAHAGGTPLPWKTAELCANECPFNLEYMECGNTCRATCAQPESSQPCEEHCESGCFCPAGMVFDDVTQSGCVALQLCYCQHNGKAYGPGESFSGPCRTCTCTLGKWSCQEHECPATCSFLGGSHITTYDDKSYTFHGECTFVLSKDINGSYIVLGDIAKLSQTDTESLMAVTLLYGAKRKIKIESTGKVFYNHLAHELPLNIDNITVFRPSTFFVVVHAVDGLQLEIQIVPTMQLYIKVDVSYKGQLRGLCGDFNDVEADDFKTTNGMIAGTAATYANTWRAQPSCPDVTNRISNPCSLSVDKERYSNYWCALLSDANGIFAPCHSEIDPSVYEVACLHDTCLCERSEDCMCAALSSYVHACRAVGVSLKGWRNTTCTKYSSSCPEGLVYSYRLTGCQPSCLGLSQPHASCQVAFSPMDGCGCAPGTYLNEEGRCVPASQCCCYEGDVVIRPGQTHWKQGTACTCKDGVQHCVGKATSCTAPMVFFNCSGLQQGARGSECQKSCRAEDSECISDRCVSGCMCPEGSLTDGAGGCVKEDLCPCLYNSVSYTPGQTVKVDCNTCECRARKWECTTHECDGICTIYGDGHYISFDEKKFSFNGDCGYTFAQDYCHGEMSNGTFRVVTENIPCASIDSTCSMAIKLYLGNTEILLSDEKIKVIKQSHEAEIPYQVHSIGIYLVIEAKNGLILIWNKKTTLMIKLNPSYKGQLCGLCGNYDGSVKNDFTTRNHEVVAEAVQFGNSWKVSPTCPDVDAIKRPCQLYSHRQAWALKHCSIINSEVFAACHSQVDPTNYYDACVKDTCACNSGGDCECFCSAVEAYAAACNRAGACVRWRTPSICPLFCDFYNPIGECEWHYEPCGDTCLKTCKNPTATCSSQIPAMEGCYPRCPPDQPYLEERTMKCVSNQQCGCYDNNDKHYEEGDTMPSEGNCKTCRCSSTQRTCKYDVQACICIYNGNKYHYGATIYSTHDGDGACFTAVCEEGGHINRTLTICPFTTPTPTTTTQEPTTTIFTFSTSGVITFTTTVPPTYSTLTTIEQSSTTTTTAQSTTITTTEQPTTTREHPSTTTTTEQPTLGEKWQTGCQECVCAQDTYEIQCVNITCEVQEPVPCDQPGEELVTISVDCCDEFECLFQVR